MSKVECFACHKFRHTASECPNKKKGKGKIATAQMDKMAKKLENFALVSCLSRTITRGV